MSNEEEHKDFQYVISKTCSDGYEMIYSYGAVVKWGDIDDAKETLGYVLKEEGVDSGFKIKKVIFQEVGIQ